MFSSSFFKLYGIFVSLAHFKAFFLTEKGSDLRVRLQIAISSIYEVTETAVAWLILSLNAHKNSERSTNENRRSSTRIGRNLLLQKFRSLAQANVPSFDVFLLLLSICEFSFIFNQRVMHLIYTA
jgi:hypothetical protein